MPNQPTVTYYKATRPDGRDFYTGTILYEVGKSVRPKRTKDAPVICGPGYLHAADVSAETLLGGLWPCRLFEVSGKPYVGFDARHKHKGGFKQLTVVREIDAHLALGPNGRAVASIIERARILPLDEIGRLSAAWTTARSAARDAAMFAVRDAARGAARNAAWTAARDAAMPAARDAEEVAIPAWDAAMSAARAAVAALSRDLITTKQFNLLYGPWRSVFGDGDLEA